jgi:heat shock protein HtpX
MASFFDEINRNRINSAILIILFCGLFAAILYLVVWILGGGIFALAIGSMLILIYALFSYFYGHKLVLKVSGAQKADPKQYSFLFATVEGLAAAIQVPTPEIYIINDPNPNAFATGRDRKHACVAVTTGLLTMMNKEELEGVLAHEMSHIQDNDILYMMIAVIFAGVIGIVAALLRNALLFGMLGEDRRGGGMIILIAIVVGILAPIFALLLKFAISRRREYMADANGARLIRDPGALASALKKIQAYTKQPNAKPVRKANEINSALYFSNPLKGGSIMNIFSTHPPIEERIARLQKMY